MSASNETRADPAGHKDTKSVYVARIWHLLSSGQAETITAKPEIRET
jgi:hypothetical protein